MQFFISFFGGVIIFYSFRYFPYSTSLIALAASVFCFLNKRIAPVLFIACGIAFAFYRFTPETEIPYTKDKIAVRGMFNSCPVRTGGGNIKQTFTTVSANNMVTGERMSALSGKEIVVLSERAFDPGTECELGITFLKSNKRLNPGEFRQDETYAKLSDTYRESKRPTLYSMIQDGRYRINNYIEDNIKGDPGVFVTSITTGQMTNMSDELRDAFSVTGLTHILSISGSHFGLFSVLLFGLFRSAINALPYRLLQRFTIYLTPSQAAAVLCAPFMIAYLFLSGASIPAVRSFVMISLFLLGLIIGKKGYWLNSLLFAAFIIVVWDPEAIFNLSFQLSFLAVLFIGFAVHQRGEKKPGGERIFAYVKSSLAMTLAASLGTAPLVAYYFHYFSIISPVSNLVLAPLIGFFLIPVSVFSCFLFLLTGHFVFTSVVSFISDMSIRAVYLLSHVPYASVNIPPFPPALLLLFYIGLIAYLFVNHMRNSRVMTDQDGAWSIDEQQGSNTELPENSAAGSVSRTGAFREISRKYLPVAFLAPFVIYFVLAVPAKKYLSVTFLDVGQGDSAVAELPDGRVMVIDTGRTGRETVSFLKYMGRKTVDVLALSHIHPDHTGGLDVLMKKFAVREIWDNGRIAYAGDIKTRSLNRGDMIEGSGYRICALHPSPGFYTMGRGGTVAENNDSLVLRIEGDRLSFLFTGDIQEEAEEDMLRLGGWLRSKVIKIPHHGGKSSAYGPFVGAVSPEIAVISVGRDNPFGHPHWQTLDLLDDARIVRTDLDGAIKISEDKKGIVVKTYQECQLKEAKCLSDELKNLRRLLETW